MVERFTPDVTDADLKREKARARELRQSAWWKRRVSGGVCHYCRRHVGPKALTADHVIPLIRGGRSVRANLVPACKDCNSKKQSLLPWEWDAYRTGLGPRDEGECPVDKSPQTVTGGRGVWLDEPQPEARRAIPGDRAERKRGAAGAPPPEVTMTRAVTGSADVRTRPPPCRRPAPGRPPRRARPARSAGAPRPRSG